MLSSNVARAVRPEGQKAPAELASVEPGFCTNTYLTFPRFPFCIAAGQIPLESDQQRCKREEGMVQGPQ